MRVIDYTPNSIVDGKGVRQVFWLAGCPHHCEGCHNTQTWNRFSGDIWTHGMIVKTALDSPYNVTFSGGDPFVQKEALLGIVYALKNHGKNIWIYTGYTWEELIEDPCSLSILHNIDVLVDGKFVKELYDATLKFRGSSNQRIIDVQKSLANNKVITMEV